MESPPNLLTRLLSDNNSMIYLASRLFDIDEKVKSEYLEQAVLSGIRRATRSKGIPDIQRHFTFVPFRDAGQEELQAEDKTKILYDNDISRLNNTVLMVAYIDGLAKDEGVCFELGYAFSKQIPILLISTDFISHRLPNGLEVPLDPLILNSATRLIRLVDIPLDHGTFLDNLLAARQRVFTRVSEDVYDLVASPLQSLSKPHVSSSGSVINVFAEFGGEIFEWQSMLAKKLSAEVRNERIQIVRTKRYQEVLNEGNSINISQIANTDLKYIDTCSIVIICSDSDECPSGSAFIQGYARGLQKEIWLYNSKRTVITGPGGYVSSRNLMLDYSANKVFRSFAELIDAMRAI